MRFIKYIITVVTFSLVMWMSFNGGAEARSQCGHPSQKESDRQSSSQQRSQVRWGQITGKVEKIKEVAVDGSKQKHLAVVLNPDWKRGYVRSNSRAIVDLGPAKQVRDLEIEQGDRLSARGPTVRTKNHSVMLARQVQAGGRFLNIQREPRQEQTAGARPQTRTIKGEVVLKGVVVEVDRDGFYVVQQPNGRQANLIVAQNLNRGINVGDRIQAQVKEDGTVMSISRTSDQAGGQAQSATSDERQSENQLRSNLVDAACRNVTPRGLLGGTLDWQWKSDQELKEAVECQLARSPFVEGEGIDVSVSDGTAILRGTVQDQDSIRSAIVDAYGAGVKDVVSKLEVDQNAE